MFASFNARALGLTVDAAEAIAIAAAAGFTGVDLLVRDLLAAGHDPRELKARMDDLGVQGGAWPLPVAWRGDGAQYQRDLAELPRHAAAAAQLGLFRTGTWVLPELPTPSSQPDQVLEYHVERLGAIARILGDHGSRLGLEVIGVESFRAGCGPAFFTRLSELGPLLHALDAEAPGAVGILVDLFHLYAAGETIDDALRWGTERVVWTHVADLPAGAAADRRLMRDGQRGLPGENGTIPLGPWLAQLASHGVSGPVTVEPLGGCATLLGLDPPRAAACAADALRSIWPLEPVRRSRGV